MSNKLASFENDIDFPRIWRIGSSSRPSLVLISLGRAGRPGPQPRHRLRGRRRRGRSPAHGDVSVAEARTALGPVGAPTPRSRSSAATRSGSRPNPPARRPSDNAVTDALADLAGADTTEVGVSTVGPTWGDEITAKAQRALVFFFVIIAGYIALRLEWKMAIGALAAVVHDIADHRRHLRPVPVRGHPGHGDRLPHHPRLLALRHDRRVRQGQGQRRQARGGPEDDLHRHDEPVAQPGADAVAQHHDHVAAARWSPCSWSARSSSGRSPSRSSPSP